jgi:hypothetical protein
MTRGNGHIERFPRLNPGSDGDVFLPPQITVESRTIVPDKPLRDVFPVVPEEARHVEG